MGNADEIQTPKGLFATRNIGTHMSYFIANYKGGRNESFMYGVDEKPTDMITTIPVPTLLVWLI